MVPDGFRLQESPQSKPASLDNSLLIVKRGVLVGLGMGWFGGLITRKSQERTKDMCDYTAVCILKPTIEQAIFPIENCLSDENENRGENMLFRKRL